VTRQRSLAVLARTAALVGLVGMMSFAPDALGQANESRIKDQPEEGQGTEKVPARDRDPLRGSTLLLDQSASTQTVGLENAEQSKVPYYGLWLSFRPRYNFDQHWRVQARFDYYKELTNSQETTDYREDVFGDIWTDVVYASPLAPQGPWKNTKVSLGLRALWPTSKQSHANGTYVTLGVTAGVSQKIPIRSAGARVLDSARVGLSFAYLHAFTQATTATDYGNFSYPSESVADSGLGPASYTFFTTDQLTGQTLVEHQLYGILDTGLQITPKLGLTVDAILINNWHYAPTRTCVDIATDCVSPPSVSPVTGADNQFTQLFWFVASADYEIIPELSVGIGYYNLSNTVATDGTLRGPFSSGFDNVFWSPDARVFLDLTANLDKIFEYATGTYRAGQTSQAAQAARQQAVVSGMR
jgi:hypothetical protein